MKRNHYNLKQYLFLMTVSIMIGNTLSAQSYDIYVFDIKEGKTKKVTSLSDAGEFNPSWSGNGKKIAFDLVGPQAAPFEQSIFITDLKTGISKPLIGAEGGNDAAWAPSTNDENETEDEDVKNVIAFDDWHIYPYSIYTVPAKGGTRTLLRSNAHHASWNPKGNKIAFDDNNGYISTKDIKTGAETFVTWYGDRPTWSPDGQYIAFDGWGWIGGGVWIIQVDATGNPLGWPTQITTSGYGPTWSKNSKTIYFIDWQTGDPDVWSVPASGGKATRICGRTGGFDKGDYDPTTSKDGRFIAFSSFTDAGLSSQNNVSRPSGPSVKAGDLSNFSLSQNTPNPFTGETKISFTVASATHVNLEVYNISGQKIKTLVDANYDAGNYLISWSGKDNAGKTMPAGIYLYQVKAGDFLQTKKMILIK
jgi:Tol biopolymer transport system component